MKAALDVAAKRLTRTPGAPMIGNLRDANSVANVYREGFR